MGSPKTSIKQYCDKTVMSIYKDFSNVLYTNKNAITSPKVIRTNILNEFKSASLSNIGGGVFTFRSASTGQDVAVVDTKNFKNASSTLHNYKYFIKVSRDRNTNAPAVKQVYMRAEDILPATLHTSYFDNDTVLGENLYSVPGGINAASAI